jgi:putative phosphoesterase
MVRVGLISDTHGLLRPQALAALQGSDFIVHAGDIGSPMILQQLASIAPVTAVRGNNDRDHWADSVPETALLEAGGMRIHVLHDLKTLRLAPAADGVRVVVSGHSHKPQVQQQGGVLFVNPGSAGPRRFKLPVSIGWLRIEAGEVTAGIVELAA